MQASFLTTTLIHLSNASIHATALRVCTIIVSVCGCVSCSVPSFSVVSVVVESVVVVFVVIVSVVSVVVVSVVVASVVVVSVSDSKPPFSVAVAVAFIIVGAVFAFFSSTLSCVSAVDFDASVSNFVFFVVSVGEVFVVGGGVDVVVLAAMGVLVAAAINMNLLVYFSTLSVDFTLPTTSLSTSSISLT